jgi:hypothetical protein
MHKLLTELNDNNDTFVQLSRRLSLMDLDNLTAEERKGIAELPPGHRDSKEGLSDFDILIGGKDSEGILGLVDGAVKDRTTSETPGNVFRATGCRPAGYTAKILDEGGVPNIRWGHWAASVMGHCMPHAVSDFC